MKELEQRLTDLENEVARLRENVEGAKMPWWQRIAGSFRNDPYYEDAMRQGKKYRDSLKPKKAPKKERKNAHS